MAQLDEDSDEEIKIEKSSSDIDPHKVSLNRESEYSESDLESKVSNDEVKPSKNGTQTIVELIDWILYYYCKLFF